ncbi:MAG: M23 family metallopeptidase [Labilithrix sp.]|nr:M23 family metallopeptidase [Labilithrix sp.]MCW5816395.1 M23 family metallopeptidase [Labilithrix sp.]
MKSILAASLVLFTFAACAQAPEPSDEASTPSAFASDCHDYVPSPDTSLSWPVVPFDGRAQGGAWLPAEFDRVNPRVPGSSACFRDATGALAPLNTLKHTGRDIFFESVADVYAPTSGTIVKVEHEPLSAVASSDVVLLQLDLNRFQRQAIADRTRQYTSTWFDATGPWYAVYRHLAYGSARPEGTRVNAGDVIGRIANQGPNTHLHLEARWKSTIDHTCPASPMIAPGYFPVGTDLVAKGYLDPLDVFPILSCATGCFLTPVAGNVLRANVNPAGAVRCAALNRGALDIEGQRLYGCDPSAGTWTFTGIVAPTCH